MITLAHYIDGKLVPPAGAKYLDNPNPATGQVFSRVPAGDEADVELAVAAAQRAFPAWSQTSIDRRSEILLAIADGIHQHFDALAEAETTDTGKPISLSRRMDIPRARHNFEFFGKAITSFASESHAMDNGPDGTALNYTLRQPLGVVGCIAPWNLPLYLFTWKIAPALAAGNCVVAKPTEVAPYTAYLLSDICTAAGLPPGVLNIVHGTGPAAGAAIVKHPAVKAISFTGGTKTGAEIARVAAPMFKKLSLELGGKNPTIIFADADYEKALTTAVQSSFTNQGQICLCGSRIFVEQSVYDKFKADFVAHTRALVIGDPMEAATQFGALSSRPHFEKVSSYIELAQAEGGTILTGGSAYKPKGRCADGYFMQPTVIEGLSYNCRTNQEEIFGPVVTLTPFKAEDEVVAYANSVGYGLAANLWTQDLGRAHRVAARLEDGIVWINCWLLRDLRTPFGGVKNSGMGREGGWEALRFFTEPKNVCIKF